MMKHMMLLLLLFFGISYTVWAVLSPSELTQLNQPKDNLDSVNLIITTSLNTFKTAVQPNNTNLLPQINNTQEEINNYYNDALKQLQIAMSQAQQDINSKSGIARNIALANAISNFNGIVDPAKTSMEIAFSQINNVVINAMGQENLNQALKQAQEAQQNQNEYHQRILTLFQDLKPIIQSFSNQSDLIRNAIIKQIQSGLIGESTISTITNNSKTLMKQANEIYNTNKFSVLASDSSNYVVASFNQLTQYYNDEMAVTVSMVNSLLTDPRQMENGFAPLAQLGLRILGTTNSKLSEAIKRLPTTMIQATTDVLKHGYNVTIQNLATTYFGMQATSILQEYRNTKEKVTFNIFVNALQQLTNKYSAPTDVQVGYALIYYSVIRDNFDVLAQQLTIPWQAQIAATLGVFFAARGQTALTSMQPGEDNSVLLQNAIDSYNQASQYYAAAGNDQNAGLAKAYSSISSSLATAQKTLQKGVQQEKANDFTDAINSYQEAAEEFKQAGDAVNATLANFNLQKLNATKKQQDGQNVLNDYVKTSKASFIQYMSFISTSSGQTVEKFDTYAPLYTDLQTAVTTAIQAYEIAKTAYEDLSTTQIGQGISQDANAQLVIINNSISWLTSMNIALENLNNGDETLRSMLGSNSTNAMFSSINNAEALYNNAIKAFRDADAIYNKYPIIQSNIIVLPNSFAQNNVTLQSTLANNQLWTWNTVAYRHIAAFYIAIASKMTTNIIVNMQCYGNASIRNPLLSPDMVSFLQNIIQNLKDQKSNVDKLFQQAQQSEAQALVATAQDWQADPTIATYTSKANSLWQSTLMTYANVYNFGNTEVKDTFMNAVDEYVRAYKAANIPAQYYPDLGQALILYNKYVFFMTLNDIQNSNQVLSTIKPLISEIFDQGNSLEQSVSAILQTDANLDALITASSQQQEFIVWQQHIEQSLNNQQKIVNTIAPNSDTTKLQLITKMIDQKSGITTYTFNLGNKSVSFNVPLITLAQLNAQIGTKAFKEKDYITAYNGYAVARKLYDDQGKISLSDTLITQFNLSRTLATAQQFRDLILPNKEETRNILMIKIADISVPQRYELEVYQQEYQLSVPAGFDMLSQATTAAQKEQLQNQLLGMTAMMYLYNIFKGNGLDINDVIDLNTMNPKSTISSANLNIVQNAVQQTKNFQTDLQDRLSKKVSSLYVIEKNGIYYIGEIYKPIPGIFPTDEQGNSTLPYITYPYAVYYYLGAYDLFKPGTQNVNIGGNLYVPGNDTQLAKDVLALIANAYLSTAASNVSDMQGSGSKVSKILNVIKAIKHGDATVSLSSYMDEYTYIKNFYLNLILFQYDTAYTYYGQYLNNQQYAKNLSLLIADTYTQLADTLAIFLIGNPLNSDYSTIALPDIENFYKTAVNYYNSPDKTKVLYQKIGQLYTNAGQQVVNQGDFIDALGFLYRAEQTYKNIPQTDSQTKQLLENATLLKLKTMFYGSTQNLQGYADKRFAGQTYPNSQEKRPLITLTLSTGQKVQETFVLLQQQYQTAGTGDIDQAGVDSAELSEYSNIKSEILDGLIFYSASSTAASNELPTQSQKQTTTNVSGAPDPIAQTALDLINSYTIKNNISLSSADEITQFLESKNFSSQINGGFDQFYQKIQKATSENDKQVGYSGIMQWANKMYFAFAQVYMRDYLGGEVAADQWTDFAQAIKSEEQEIQAPSSLYT